MYIQQYIYIYIHTHIHTKVFLRLYIYKTHFFKFKIEISPLLYELFNISFWCSYFLKIGFETQQMAIGFFQGRKESLFFGKTLREGLKNDGHKPIQWKVLVKDLVRVMHHPCKLLSIFLPTCIFRKVS